MHWYLFQHSLASQFYQLRRVFSLENKKKSKVQGLMSIEDFALVPPCVSPKTYLWNVKCNSSIRINNEKL